MQVPQIRMAQYRRTFGSSPRWSRVWPTPQEHPGHAGLEAWMAAHGYQILSRSAGWSGFCQDDEN
jgi:hypothetical protein